MQGVDELVEWDQIEERSGESCPGRIAAEEDHIPVLRPADKRNLGDIWPGTPIWASGHAGGNLTTRDTKCIERALQLIDHVREDPFGLGK